MKILAIVILSFGSAFLTSCDQPKSEYHLSREDVEAEQESYFLDGGDLVVEEGADLEGPFARGPGVAGGDVGSIRLTAGGKSILVEPEAGHRIEAWSYLMEDGRGWVIGRKFPSR